MQKLQIAVAGAGLIGRIHTALVQASGECALSAIIDPAPAAVGIAVPIHIVADQTSSRIARRSSTFA